MTTHYKYIHFTELFPKGRKTRMFQCVNNNSSDVLGTVEYYTAWRSYIFEPAAGSVFNATCLIDILHFIQQL